ncbi:MAG: hypothetical protein RMK89_08360 [Armatimonadota bacterium]|nr:hypothetical protein [Armatimonadota bacterium]MDW8143458.1 hypothetical protein [Armatimonadota bacterium]
MKREPSVPRWLWWLFGVGLCIGFILLCSCGIGGFFAFRLLKQEFPPPMTLADIRKIVPDLPVYPQAKFDEQTTNSFESRFSSMALMGRYGETSLYLYFRTKEPFEKVKGWYQRQLPKHGWYLHGTGGYFRRGGEILIVARNPFGGFFLFYGSAAPPDWLIRRLEERVKRNPEDYEAWASLAYGYFCLGKWQDSQQALKKAMFKPLRNEDSQRRLAKLLLWVGSEERVLPFVRAYSGNEPFWRYGEARLLLRLGEWRAAEQVLTSALSLDGKSRDWNDWFHTLRGIARWKQNKLQEALSDFEQAYRLDKSWWQLTAWANWRLGKRERAKEIIRAAAQKGYREAENILKGGRQAVWPGIITAGAPQWLTKRWFEGAKVKGEWAVECLLVPETRNETLLKDAIVFAVNGQTFVSDDEFWRRLRVVNKWAKVGETATFSIWRRGKVERVIVKFEPFLK